MNEITWILGGLVIAVASAFVGSLLGSRKVTESGCHERRQSCIASIQIQLLALKEGIESLHKKIDRINGRTRQ